MITPLNRRFPTKRQIEIATLSSEGKQYKEIAALLKLSAKTVEVHRRNLYKIMGVHTAAECTRRLIEQGFIRVTVVDAVRQYAEQRCAAHRIPAHITSLLMPRLIAGLDGAQ